MTHTFEFEGAMVEYFPAVVRTQLEKRRVLRVLIEIYGLQGQDVAGDIWDDFDNFASAVSQTKTEAAWWANSMAGHDRIKEAFECFLEQPPGLVTSLLMANEAVSTPKKTTEKT
jgi:hypothetical protein